jgi:hypothetical protein
MAGPDLFAFITPVTSAGEEIIGMIKTITADLEGLAPLEMPFALPIPPGKLSPSKTKVETKDDNKHVLKVSEAIKCAETYFDDGGNFKDLLSTAAKNFIGGTSNIGQTGTKTLAICFRKKQLQQNNPRHSVDGPHETRK